MFIMLMPLSIEAMINAPRKGSGYFADASCHTGSSNNCCGNGIQFQAHVSYCCGPSIQSGSQYQSGYGDHYTMNGIDEDKILANFYA